VGLGNTMNLWPAVVAFSIGGVFTWLEFCTSKYSTTFFLIAWKRPLLIYCAIYGAIAVGGFLLSDFLIKSGKLKIEGLGTESPYILAAVLGFTSKAVIQLNIYTVTTGSTPFPIGFQTIVQLFEPYLVRSIILEEFNEVRWFVSRYASKFSDLSTVKTMIKQNIPASLSQQERAAFENEVNKDEQAHEAMERFLRFGGRKTFLRIFK
jgi:hypothetical protein